ncbi:MAG: chorismate synthase [Planctomycetes bacterium]|nr:chorismate synthase [Planctomycetota bacterium]
MGSFLGQLLRIATFGESHGPAVGVVIDGCPPGLALDLELVQRDLDRRRPGQSSLTSARGEADRVEVLSGLFEGRTTGAPLALMVRNEDARPQAYEAMRELYRPSHADYSYDAKYGTRDWRGGGRASARETVGRVAAGAVGRQWLAAHGVEVLAWVEQVGSIVAAVDPARVRFEDVEAHPTRCPDPTAAARMQEEIEATRRERDTIGGVVGCVARGVPAGLGEPVFDKLSADLAKALISLPASRGFEIGRGFAASAMRGSVHNDPFTVQDGAIRTTKNDSGGIQGGISNGEAIELRVAFKPVATIFREQETVTRAGEAVNLTASGRHDPCVVPRAVPMVEAMVLLVLWDHWLRQRAVRG